MSPPLFRNFTIAIANRIKTLKSNLNKRKLKCEPDEMIVKEKWIGNMKFTEQLPVTTTTNITWKEEPPDDNFLNNRILTKMANGTATLEDVHDLKMNGHHKTSEKRTIRPMAKMNMYADDSGCRRSHKNKDDLEREVPPILEKVFEQMKSSRLQVNSEKTTLLVFCDTRKRNNELILEHSNSFCLKVEGITVEESLTSKLLGVIFDRTSTYEAHIKNQKTYVRRPQIINFI